MDTYAGGVLMPEKRRYRDREATAETAETADGTDAPAPGPEIDHERLRRRARFLRELSEARELRERVQPRRARVARMRHQMRMRTFRW
ncbi:hypothetical protein N566_20335 [Streptomycetaceae bacterium MP113-05]|nr:hypothetical protein N566_20335 [Streptomycetaceae bacterium MP113-05]